MNTPSRGHPENILLQVPGQNVRLPLPLLSLPALRSSLQPSNPKTAKQTEFDNLGNTDLVRKY